MNVVNCEVARRFAGLRKNRSPHSVLNMPSILPRRPFGAAEKAADAAPATIGKYRLRGFCWRRFIS
jgi:hypothetical protein